MLTSLGIENKQTASKVVKLTEISVNPTMSVIPVYARNTAAICLFVLSFFPGIAPVLRVALQVLQFVIAHMDVFSGILRGRHPVLTVDSLQELALVTGVVGRAALDGTST